MKAAALRSAIESWTTCEVIRKSFGPSIGQRKTSDKQSYGEGPAWIVVQTAVNFSDNRQGEPGLQWAGMGICASVPLRQNRSMFIPAGRIGNGKHRLRRAYSCCDSVATFQSRCFWGPIPTQRQHGCWRSKIEQLESWSSGRTSFRKAYLSRYQTAF